MWDLRRFVSLLLSEGHSKAQLYPLGFMYDEMIICVERENNRKAADATLSAISYASTQSKKGAQLFKDMVSKLSK